MRQHCLVVSLILVTCWTIVTSVREPVFTRTPTGQLQVQVSDIPGLQRVTIRVAGLRSPESEEKSVTAVLKQTASGQWRTAVPDVTSSDAVLTYVITYQFPETEYIHEGSQYLSRVQTSLELLGTPHHLHRRAYTAFWDDFSEGHIDGSKWTHDVSADGVGNHEFQMYSPEARNSYVKNGVLHICPTLTTDRFGDDFLWTGTFDARQVYGTCTNNDCHRKGWNEIHPIMSALLRTTANIKYGKVEVMAKLPKGDWLWPAIWMMPRDQEYGWWPKSGEIDIMESMGNEHMYYSNGDSAGVDVDRATIHYGTGGSTCHKSHGETYRIQGTTFGDGFHKYWLDWTEHYIKIGVDDHTLLNFNTPAHGFWQESGCHGNNIWSGGAWNAPFDKKFYLILNVAVGGDFFWDGYHNEPYDKPWHSGDSEKMMYFWNAREHWLPTWHGEDTCLQVDWVKMEQY